MSRLHQLHRWAGRIAGPLLVLIALSGAVLLFRQDAERVAPRTIPAAGRAALPIDELARRVLLAYPRGRISYILLPGEAGAPFEFVLLPEDSSSLFLAADPFTGATIGAVQKRNAVMTWAGRLHSSLLLGASGRRVAVLLTAIQAAMIVSGLFLSLRRKLSWHARFGWIAAIPMLLYSFSGMLLLGIRPAEAPPPHTGNLPSRTIGEYLAISRKLFPSSSPTWISLADPVSVRFRLPGDLQQKGSNDLYLDPASARVIRADLIEKKHLAQRLRHHLAALHFGEPGGGGARPLYAIFALFPFFLWLSSLNPKRNGPAASTRGPASTSTELPPRVDV